MNFPYKKFEPDTNLDAIIQIGKARFTILTSRLIRMEYHPSKNFEDRATQVFWYRNMPTPVFSKIVNGNQITLETDYLKLTYIEQDLGFDHRYLHVELKENSFVWQYGQTNHSNLGGTVRTLDNIDGSIPLNPGLISRNGWAVVDDSRSLVFDDDGWLTTRESPHGTVDQYFFGYGRDFTACLQDFQKISGQAPILPRFALGNWWSRYWAYHQDDLLGLMKDFKSHHTPLSVCIIDMDWHIVETGNKSSGWTGYTWNEDLFPDPQGFLDDLDQLGLKKALNLHPASGIYPHETQYEAMGKRLNIDTSSQQPIPFSIADPEFTQAYFELLHHPYEEMGVDFWWIDWQQGTKSDLKGLDPLFWLNHLHFYDLARDGKKRPFIFSRWAGLGSQRYPIGFSGDTYITWNTLKFQPYFTATAANVAYGWWSHDIGGHMGGIEEPELYLRWLQLGVFSPILRVHSTNNPFHERLPWAFNAEIEQHAKNAFRLRHALIPYLYTAAWVNYTEGILPIRPMYHTYPDDENAYLCPDQYTFGSELMVCPFTSPRDQNTNLSRQVIWLPEGQWFGFFSGQAFDGDGWYAYYGGLGQIPVFAKAGAIVPMAKLADWGGVDLPDELIIHIFPGANNIYKLYEDDGETQEYQQGKSFTTAFIYDWDQEQAVLKIQPDAGNPGLFAVDRQYCLVFHAINEPSDLLITIDGQQINLEQTYDEHFHQFIISNIPLQLQSTLKIEMSSKSSLLHQPDTRKQNLERLLKDFKMESFVKQYLANQLDDLMANPLLLVRYADRMTPSHVLALYETWRGKDKKPISSDPEVAYQLISNLLYHA